MAMKKTRKLPGEVNLFIFKRHCLCSSYMKGILFKSKMVYRKLRGGTLASLGDTHSPK